MRHINILILCFSGFLILWEKPQSPTVPPRTRPEFVSLAQTPEVIFLGGASNVLLSALLVISNKLSSRISSITFKKPPRS